MTHRQKRILIATLLANFLLAMLILAFLLLTAGRNNLLHHPCVFKTLFGLYCPGCGGTRALRALLSGHPIESLLLNPLLSELVLIVLFYEWSALRSVLPGKAIYFQSTGFQKVQSRLVLVFALSVPIFFVLRNILVCFGFDPIGDLTDGESTLLLKGVLFR